MESKRIDEDRVLANADAASRGARQAMLDTENANAEKKARAKLAADRGSDRLMNWGVSVPEWRGKYPRPACTYRGPRRNAARLAHWPSRRRYRLEPCFDDRPRVSK